MPIYEYHCNACGHCLEKLQKMSDSPLTDCPACGQSKLEKRTSAAGFRLSGRGWYETDFKKSQQKNLVQPSEPTASPEPKTAPPQKDPPKNTTAAD